MVVERVTVIVGGEGVHSFSAEVELEDEDVAASAWGIILRDSMLDCVRGMVSDQRALIVASSSGNVVVVDVGTGVFDGFVGDRWHDVCGRDVEGVLVLMMISGFGHPFGITIPSYTSSMVTVLEQIGAVEVAVSCSRALRVSLVCWFPGRGCLG